MTRIDRNAHGVGEFLEQSLLAIAELVAVLRHIGSGDLEQRLFVGVDIGLELAHRLGELDAGRHAQNLAGEGGDAAVGISGLDSAGAGQLFAQLFGFSSGNLGKALARHQQPNADGKGCLEFLWIHVS